MRTKYMTVEHHIDTRLHIANGNVGGRIPIHDMLSNYYWTRIDENHIFLMGEHPLCTHHALHEHPRVVILPYLHHRKTIVDHYVEKDKMSHHCALQQHLDLDINATMQELVDAAIAKHGPVFSPRI